MTDGLKAYPSYKDAQTPWGSEIPEHWRVRKLRGVLRAVSRRNRPDLPLLSVVRERGVILRDTSNKDENHNYIPDDLTNYKVAQRDEFVVNKMKAWQGSYGVSPFDGIVSPAYFVFRVDDAKPDYFHRALRSRAYVPAFTRTSDGVRIGQWDLSMAGMREIAFAIPPEAEQAGIVRFLNHADQRIRRYIRAKQKLIALLGEQKQTFVHHLATRGVGSNAKLKTTGNPWFPRIPAHWNVMPMRRVITRSVDGPHHSPEYLDQGIPFLSARNIKVDGWSLADVKFISKSDYETFCERVKPEVGDVLYTKGGTTGIARAVDLEYPFQVWVHVAVLKVNRKQIAPRYLAIALNSPRCYEQSQLLTRGATNQDLGLGRMKDIVLPVPPMDEQADVIEQVETVEKRVHVGVQSALREIQLVEEFRTRLISDVVTGSIDVREATKTLDKLESGAREVSPNKELESHNRPICVQPTAAREGING